MKSGIGNQRKVLFLLVLSLGLVACGARASVPEDEPYDRRTLTFMAGYRPQANLPFVGVYVAEEEGFFDDVGLDVTIEHSAGHGEHLQLLTAGKVQITTQDAAVLMKRRSDPGLPLVSIALLGQRGQQVFSALASSGMESPSDWEGHVIGYKGTPPPDIFALLNAAGLDPDAVELVNVGFDPRVLTEGQVDVYPLYRSNEPYLIRSWGYDLITWDVADYGVATLGLTYVTSEQVLTEDPEMLTCFLQAALRGIEYAESHRERAVEIVLKYTGPETDANHMRFMLDTELEDAKSELTAEHGVGWQDLEQWQSLAEVLEQYEAMTPINVEDAFTTEILQRAYAGECRLGE